MSEATALNLEDVALRVEFITTLPVDAEYEHRFIVQSGGKVMAEHLDTDVCVHVGNVSVSHIKVGDIDGAEESLADIADAHSSKMLRLYEDLWAGSEANDNSDLMAAYSTYVSDLLLIDSIEIFEPYRNQGIGGKVVLTLIEAHSYCQVIALKPFAFELSKIDSTDPPEVVKQKQDAHNRGAARLRKYYEKFGFRLTTSEHMTYCTNLKTQPTREEAKDLRAVAAKRRAARQSRAMARLKRMGGSPGMQETPIQ
jgi:hypothetical protein